MYNNSDQPVDLSGWFLTDEDTNLERWAFPAGTVVAPRDTLIVWADDAASPGLHASFKLSASGETIYLVTPQKAFADQVTFTDAEEDFSYARSPNGTGGWSWTDSPSFDAAN